MPAELGHGPVQRGDLVVGLPPPLEVCPDLGQPPFASVENPLDTIRDVS
jgi:hypothetical protein